MNCQSNGQKSVYKLFTITKSALATLTVSCMKAHSGQSGEFIM